MRHWPQGDEPHKTSLALLPAAEHRSRRHRPLAQTTRLRLMKRIFSPVPKKRYRNRAGVLEKPCSGTFGSWLHAFLGKTGASPKVKSYVTLPFRKIRN